MEKNERFGWVRTELKEGRERVTTRVRMVS